MTDSRSLAENIARAVYDIPAPRLEQIEEAVQKRLDAEPAAGYICTKEDIIRGPEWRDTDNPDCAACGGTLVKLIAVKP